jgi:hypothetical protein
VAAFLARASRAATDPRPSSPAADAAGIGRGRSVAPEPAAQSPVKGREDQGCPALHSNPTTPWDTHAQGHDVVAERDDVTGRLS